MASMSLIPKILLVSNLHTTSPLWAFNVTKQRWNILLETHPSRAIQRWEEVLPDLIVCDLDSDSLSIDLITKLRDETVFPILLLTSNRSDKFMLEAYEAGVNECILKPIHPLLFEAKMKAWLRHTSHAPADMLDTFIVGDIRLMPSDRALVLENRDSIHLTTLELRLLYYLMGRPGRTLTTKELCQYVWGNHSNRDAATLKTLVYRLRHKIEPDPAHPHYVHTVIGVGYQFTAK